MISTDGMVYLLLKVKDTRWPILNTTMNIPEKSDKPNIGLTRSDSLPKAMPSSLWTHLKTDIASYFSPEGSLSLYLLIGFAVLLISVAVFGEVASDITTNDFIVRFDLAVESAIHANTSPGLIQMMLIASLAGSQLIIVASIVMGALFIWRRNWRDLLLLGTAVGGEELVNLLFKSAFNRARPAFSDPIALANGFSFPSGHAMGSMVFYGLIAYFLMRRSKPTLERILIVLITLLIIVIIGFSRIYLGLHYPSDILGGYSAGLAWLAFTISGLGLYRVWRQHRHRRKQKNIVAANPSRHYGG